MALRERAAQVVRESFVDACEHATHLVEAEPCVCKWDARVA